MTAVTIPSELAQLQARVTAAFDAVQEHQRTVGLPGLEWPEEEQRRSADLMAEATAAADELRAAVDASGLVAEHGSATFQAALMQASRELCRPPPHGAGRRSLALFSPVLGRTNLMFGAQPHGRATPVTAIR